MKLRPTHGLAASLAVCLFTYSASALSAGQGRIPMVLIEEAVEAEQVTLQGNSIQAIDKVIVRPCAECPTQQFDADPGIRIRYGRKQIPNDVAKLHNGKGGTVVYNIRTGKATSVQLFVSEGDQP